MQISIGIASDFLGVSPSTLQRWDQQNFLKPSYHTAGGHLQYQFKRILHFFRRSGNKLSDFKQINSIPAPTAVL